jgi:hypothetical protein
VKDEFIPIREQHDVFISKLFKKAIQGIIVFGRLIDYKPMYDIRLSTELHFR